MLVQTNQYFCQKLQGLDLDALIFPRNFRVNDYRPYRYSRLIFCLFERTQDRKPSTEKNNVRQIVTKKLVTKQVPESSQYFSQKTQDFCYYKGPILIDFQAKIRFLRLLLLSAGKSNQQKTIVALLGLVATALVASKQQQKTLAKALITSESSCFANLFALFPFAVIAHSQSKPCRVRGQLFGFLN